MSIVKDRMLKLVDSFPNNYFDNKTFDEILLLLVKVYLDKYGEDETTIIPGTNKHINLETLGEILNANKLKEV